MSNEELINIAKRARKNAVVDISSYGVGSALLAKSGTVYIGANIEDYSIPNLSNCAERVAFQNAISHGEREFVKIAIVGGKMPSDAIDDKLSPCGLCLQYMLDFCDNIEVVTYINGKLVSINVREFLTNPYKHKKKL